MCACVVSVRGLVEWTVSWVCVTLRYALSCLRVPLFLLVLVSTPFNSTSGFQRARAWVGGMEHMFYSPPLLVLVSGGGYVWCAT